MLFNLFLQLTSKGKHVMRIKKKNPILIYIFKLFFILKMQLKTFMRCTINRSYYLININKKMLK